MDKNEMLAIHDIASAFAYFFSLEYGYCIPVMLASLNNLMEGDEYSRKVSAILGKAEREINEAAKSSLGADDYSMYKDIRKTWNSLTEKNITKGERLNSVFSDFWVGVPDYLKTYCRMAGGIEKEG
jgi:hypothetical protein